jgi:transcriptional regulator with XRE-family HTH domain
MCAESKAASAAEHRRLVDEMSLLRLRIARELTQTKIADELHMGQGDASKLETRANADAAQSACGLRAAFVTDTFGTRLGESGADAFTIMRLKGHSTPEALADSPQIPLQ